MKKVIVLCLLFSLPFTLPAQSSVSFTDYFINKTMRIDYYHTGDSDEEIVAIDLIYQQGSWAGNPNNLIDSFDHGCYFIKVYDRISNKLIYSRGFNSYFAEYQTTKPAMNGIKRTYHESALIPYPLNKVLFVLEKRNKQNILFPVFTTEIDPADIHIIKENSVTVDRIYKALYNGDPHKKVDFAWIAEGYSDKEYDKFKNDVDRFMKKLFETEPYNKYKKQFNIYGIFRPSAESGVDQPGKNIYKNTIINSSFNALDLDRYLLTEDNKSYRDIASQVPYDDIVIMVNHERYGGGGIYNFYAISTVDHYRSENVFIHELGHSFAGLGDEYYLSDVSYNEFYPPGIEPTEPNITALLAPEKLKWKSYVSKGIDIPTTGWEKEKLDELTGKEKKLKKEKQDALDELEKQNAGKDEIDKLTASYDEKLDLLKEQINKIRAEIQEKFAGKVGAFEGAGYSAKGLYRPELDCIMFSNRGTRFCKVCQMAIERMIKYYTQ